MEAKRSGLRFEPETEKPENSKTRKRPQQRTQTHQEKKQEHSFQSAKERLPAGDRKAADNNPTAVSTSQQQRPQPVGEHGKKLTAHPTGAVRRLLTYRVADTAERDDNAAADAATLAAYSVGEGARHLLFHSSGKQRDSLQPHDADRLHTESSNYPGFENKKALQKKLYRRRYAENLRKGQQPTVSVWEQLREKLVPDAARRPRKQDAKGAVLVLGVIGLMVILLLCLASSCSILLQAFSGYLTASTFPSSDEDMLAAEQQYCAMEQELQEYLDTYEQTHEYDSYEYELDEIGHDPYVLISAITVLHNGAWTIDQVQDTLQMLFEKQYVLTETETAGSSENDTGSCSVKLENMDLSRVPSMIMNDEQLAEYAGYMATLGNREDLFPGSEYIDRYIRGAYEVYEIPPEALEDERFAAMIEEAEKYLGYPYVWGGSSPSTSFDCSGFVCWVLDHSGWKIGRTTAQGLFEYCTPVSAANARPGDLIFFTGTYKTSDACSHVGIYVGEQKMLHCGDPISYTSIEKEYWQSHFYCYGRLP